MPHQLRSNQITTQWSGGKTTELLIYPENAEYKTGDYLFRLSTATVEIDESTFSSLPGVERTLMVLDGEMELNHENHHNILLKPLQYDQFKGDWKTISKGQCVDFNLMCKSGAQGTLKGFELNAKSAVEIDLESEINFLFIYKGEIELDGIQLASSQLLILDKELSRLSITASTYSIMVLVSIYL